MAENTLDKLVNIHERDTHVMGQMLRRIEELEAALRSALNTSDTENHPFRPWQAEARRLLAKKEEGVADD